MFTGLVQAIGSVIELSSGRLTLSLPEDLKGYVLHGESIAVDGCCLTAIPEPDRIHFDLSEETLRRTTLGSLETGDHVNLERALLASDRLGGHFVLGHVDTTAHIAAIAEHPKSWQLTFELDPIFDRLLFDKGSIAVSGISLTVVTPLSGRFEAWIIPETWTKTTLSERKVGDTVNIEFDVLAKHVERLMEARIARV